MSRARSRRISRRRGYVLLMVLLLLLVGSTALIATVRKTLRTSAAAHDQAAELQRRWAVDSIRRVLLPRADSMLVDGRGNGVVVRQSALMLGGQRFELTFADEQAKLNVNAALAWFGPGRATNLVGGIVSSTGSRLKPQITSGDRKLSPRAGEEGDGGGSIGRFAVRVGSFDELFPDALQSDLFIDDAALRPGDVVTCWGNGQLNLRAASREAILAAGGGTLSAADVDKLIQLRDASPDTDLFGFVASLHDGGPFSPARRRFIDNSFCHSLRITFRSPQGRRYDSIAIRDDTSATRPLFWRFDYTP